MGGRSSEHDISRASGRSVLAGLREAGFEPVAIEISREGRWQLPAPSGSDAQALEGARSPTRESAGGLGEGRLAEALPVPADARLARAPPAAEATAG